MITAESSSIACDHHHGVQEQPISDKPRALRAYETFRLEDQVLADPAMSPAPKIVGIFIAHRIDKETGMAHLSAPKIARSTGLSASGVRKSVRQLVQQGHLGIKPGETGPGNAAYYWLIPKAKGDAKQNTAMTVSAPNGNGDPAEAELRRRGRDLLGDGADNLITRLLNSYGGDIEETLDTLACAADERSPRRYIEEIIQSREPDHDFASARFS
jgi:hypothetical protein